jgi:hypothetical protein
METKEMIAASQLDTVPAITDIPWLERLMRETPRSPTANPFGRRVEEIPSEGATEHILASSELTARPEQHRTRPGLRTRA